MYFRTFSLGANTEKLIENAGFRVNSFQAVKTFRGLEEENLSQKPKDYLYNGAIWKQIDVSCYSERIILLARIPMLLFKELWDLYFNGDRDDQFGALVIISSQYEKEMINVIQSLNSEQISRGVRKKLLELKTSHIIDSCTKSEQILSAIDGALNNGQNKR